MIFKTKEGHEFDTQQALRWAFSTFEDRPNADGWRRLAVAMLAHQQACYFGNNNLIVDVRKLTCDEIDRYYDKELA